MSDRIVKIKLLADATGMVQGLGRARDAVAETKTRMEESARSSKQEWSEVGAGLTAVGVAVTGVGVAALRTGIQYNTLQQTTRAALTSLLGSAQAANQQMDKLDDFARNSPFSKSTFISAQQQMLAFGIEAKKVIPYLDGVQNAVAAAGGSNADIEGIVATMSKIQSSSKITATDLMEFGNRGVNAAELIGSQMGKTGAQIREDITAGALSAEDALDALVAGMSTKFDGAAANVKNTFAGSLDRVKAAWRDFSSELAKPLVDPNGGGALVDLLNWTADAMRNFEKLPEPIKATTSALTGLVGVGALVTGVAILALPKWVAFKDALASFTPATSAARGGLTSIVRFLGGPWGIALLAAAASVTVFNNAMSASKASAAELETGIKQGTNALDMMREQAAKNEQGLTKLFVDISSQAENLGPLLDKAADSGRGFFSSLTFNEQGMLDNLSEFGGALQSLAGSDLPRAQEQFKLFAESSELSGAQLKTLLNEMPGFKDVLIGYAEGAGMATDDSTLLKIAMQELSPVAKSAADAYLETTSSAAGLTDKLVQLIDVISEMNGLGQSAEQTNAKVQESFAKLQEYVANAQAGVDGYTLSLDESTTAGSANRAMLAAHAESLENDARAQFELESKTIGATAAAQNFESRLSSGRQEIYDTALALSGSSDEAQKFTDKVLEMPSSKEVQILLRGAAEAEQALARLNGMALQPKVLTIEEQTRRVYLKPESRALGGTVGYATGGTVGLAAGGIVRGVGGGIMSGTVFGNGTETSDSVLVRLSRGEEVIRASQAAKHRPLLKRINAGESLSPQGVFAPTRDSFAPAMPQPAVTQVIERTHTQTPTHLTLVDEKSGLVSKMRVVANQEIDGFMDEQAQENRRAGW